MLCFGLFFISAQNKKNYQVRLKQTICVDLRKNSYGRAYPLAYAVYKICKTSNVPFLYRKSLSISSKIREIRIRPLLAKNKAEILLDRITKPLGYTHVVCEQGVYILPYYLKFFENKRRKARESEEEPLKLGLIEREEAKDKKEQKAPPAIRNLGGKSRSKSKSRNRYEKRILERRREFERNKARNKTIGEIGKNIKKWI